MSQQNSKNKRDSQQDIVLKNPNAHYKQPTYDNILSNTYTHTHIHCQSQIKDSFTINIYEYDINQLLISVLCAPLVMLRC